MRSSLLALPAAIAVAALLSTTSAGCGGGAKRHAPLAPTGVVASAGDGYVTLSWNDVAGADLYIVYFATQEGVTKDNYQTLADGGRSYDASSPVQIDAPNGTTYFFVVTAVSKDGYESVDSQEVFASPSPWGPPARIEFATGDMLEPQLAQDGAGNLLAVWSRQQPNRYAIHAARRPAGGDWTSPLTIDSDAGYSYSPRIAVRDDGRTLAVWRQGDASHDSIWANEMTGGIWGSPFVLASGGTYSARNPAVALGAGGEGFAAWTQNDGTNESIWGDRFDPVGDAWMTPTLVETTSSAADSARVALDATGNGVMIWQQGSGLWTAAIASGSGSQVTTLLHGTAGVASPALAMDAAGDAIAAWLEPNPAGYDAWGAVYTGGSWGAPQLLESSPGTCGAPAIAIAQDGNGLIAFPQVYGLHANLQGVRVIGGAFHAPERLDVENSGDVKEVSASAASGGDALAVWSQEVVGLGGPGVTRNIYSNRFVVVSSSWGPPVLVSRYGLNIQPASVIESNGEATALWGIYGSAGVIVMTNVVPSPTPLP